jgi:hypothetical protein
MKAFAWKCWKALVIGATFGALWAVVVALS